MGRTNYGGFVLFLIIILVVGAIIDRSGKDTPSAWEQAQTQDTAAGYLDFLYKTGFATEPWQTGSELVTTAWSQFLDKVKTENRLDFVIEQQSYDGIKILPALVNDLALLCHLAEVTESVLRVDMEGVPLSSEYMAEKTINFSSVKLYTGAEIKARLRFITQPGDSCVTDVLFSGHKPPVQRMEVSWNHSWDKPSDAPFQRVYIDDILPSIIQFFSEEFGPQLPFLLRVVEFGPDNLRWAAGSLLLDPTMRVALRDPDSVERLIALLQHENPRVRQVAVYALSFSNSDVGVNALIGALFG